MVVPEFPQSIGSAGAVRPSRPVPVIRSSAPCSDTRAPRARMAASVERLSSPMWGQTTTLSPSAMAARRRARWVMLLSLGTGTTPVSGLC